MPLSKTPLTEEEIEVRVNSGISCGPGKTKQSFANESDINLLMARYKSVDNLPGIVQRMPQYGDYSNVADFQTAQNQVAKAKEVFAEIPSNIRDLVGNDPGRFIEFVSDPNNEQQLIALGLAEATTVPTPRTETPATPEAAAPDQGELPTD